MRFKVPSEINYCIHVGSNRIFFTVTAGVNIVQSWKPIKATFQKSLRQNNLLFAHLFFRTYPQFFFYLFSDFQNSFIFFPFSLFFLSLFLKELIQPSVPLNSRFRKIGTFVVIQSGLGSRNRAFLAPWSRMDPAEKKRNRSHSNKNQKPEPKQMPLLYRLLEDKKHKEIVNLLLFLR